MLSFIGHKEYKENIEIIKERIVEGLSVSDDLSLHKLNDNFLLEGNIVNLKKDLIKSIELLDDTDTLYKIEGVVYSKLFDNDFNAMEEFYGIKHSAMITFKKEIILSTKSVNDKLEFLKILNPKKVGGVLELKDFGKGVVKNIDELITSRLDSGLSALYNDLKKYMMLWKPSHQKTAEGIGELFMALFIKKTTLTDSKGATGDIVIDGKQYEVKAHGSRMKGSGKGWRNPSSSVTTIHHIIKKDKSLGNKVLVIMADIANSKGDDVIKYFGFNKSQLTHFEVLRKKITPIEFRKILEIYVKVILPNVSDALLNIFYNNRRDLHLAYATLNYDYYISQINVDGMFLIDKMNVIYIPNGVNFKSLLGSKIRADYGFSFNNSTDANSVYQFYVKRLVK